MYQIDKVINYILVHKIKWYKPFDISVAQMPFSDQNPNGKLDPRIAIAGLPDVNSIGSLNDWLHLRTMFFGRLAGSTDPLKLTTNMYKGFVKSTSIASV